MDHDSRYACIMIANSQIVEYANYEERVEQKILNILDILSLTLYDMTEEQLVVMLEQGGIDMSDPFQWITCSDYLSWYVAEDAIDITLPNAVSLMNLSSPTRQQGLIDPVMKEHMESIKRDGILFRTEIAPRIADLENL